MAGNIIRMSKTFFNTLKYLTNYNQISLLIEISSVQIPKKYNEILKKMMIFSVFSAMEGIIDGRERPETYLEGHRKF